MEQVITISGNIECMRDFSKYFPIKDMYNGAGYWEIEVTQWEVRVIAKKACADGNTLTVTFKGDGVVMFEGVNMGKEFSEFYDDHCLDQGAKFQKLLKKYSR